MKAIQFDRLGGPEVMELREIPKPELRPGTILVKNHVIAINSAEAVQAVTAFSINNAVAGQTVITG